VKRISGTSIIYTPRPEATLEIEAAALATVYKIVLNAADAHKRVTGPDGGRNVVRKDEDAHTSNLERSE
jgi:hypothetical protein